MDIYKYAFELGVKLAQEKSAVSQNLLTRAARNSFPKRKAIDDRASGIESALRNAPKGRTPEMEKVRDDARRQASDTWMGTLKRRNHAYRLSNPTEYPHG